MVDGPGMEPSTPTTTALFWGTATSSSTRNRLSWFPGADSVNIWFRSPQGDASSTPPLVMVSTGVPTACETMVKLEAPAGTWKRTMSPTVYVPSCRQGRRTSVAGTGRHEEGRDCGCDGRAMRLSREIECFTLPH